MFLRLERIRKVLATKMSVPSSSVVTDSLDDTSVLEETKSEPITRTSASLPPGSSATTDDVSAAQPAAAARRWSLSGSLSSFSLRNLWIDTDGDKLATAERELLEFCVDRNLFDVEQSDVDIECDLRPQAERAPKKPGRLSSLFSGLRSSTEPTKVTAESEESKSSSAVSAASSVLQKLTIHTTTVSKKTPFGLGFPSSAPIISSSALESKEKKTDDDDKGGSITETPPIVLMHGYGCASGYFFQTTPMILDRVQEQLKKTRGVVKPRVHVLDWLGIGQSSRPSFPSAYTTKDTEQWHVESLEEWRKAMGIQKMILVAHSLGAYMSAVYAMKYPSNVSHLVLISPVGVPKKPDDSDDFLKGLDWKRRTMFHTFRYIWDAGYTPQDFVRWAGPKGKEWTRAVVEHRLFRVEDTRFKNLLAEYLFHVYAGDGSAEYALSKILEPGAWARTPLIERLHVLKHGGVDPSYAEDGAGSAVIDREEEQKSAVKSSEDGVTSGMVSDIEQSVRVSCVYGESDWMNPAPMFELSREGRLDNTVHYCKDAGHQMVAENPSYLAKVVGNLVASSLKECMLDDLMVDSGGVLMGSDEDDSSFTLSSSSEAVYVGRKLGEVDAEKEHHRLRKLKKEAKQLQSDGTIMDGSVSPPASSPPASSSAAAAKDSTL